MKKKNATCGIQKTFRDELLDNLKELIDWAKSQDAESNSLNRHLQGTVKETCMLFSPNARGEIPGAFRPPRQPEVTGKSIASYYTDIQSALTITANMEERIH